MMAEPHRHPGEYGGLLTSAVPTIGRDRELKRIQQVVAETCSGNTRVLLFSGDAGIGKTRLLRETVSIVRAQGGRSAIGHCLDETGMPPFLPWIDIGAQLAGLAGGDSPANSIVDLLLDQSDRSSVHSGRKMESNRIRLYGAICSMLADLAHDAPLCIAFDDLQWSDATSHQLLRFIATHLGRSHLLIAATIRSESSRDNTELSRTIAEFGHVRILTEIPLTGLSEGSTEILIDELSGGLPSSVVSMVKELSSGNPFAIEEIVRSVVETGPATQTTDDEPLASVANVIKRRFDARTAGCRSALELAAIGGRDIRVEEISNALERNPERVIAELEEAMFASLIAPCSEQGRTSSDYRFVHDRIREAIQYSIPAAKVRLLHARLVATLDGDSMRQTTAQLARLAVHLEGARQFERAAVAYRQLGDAAASVNAFEDAAAAYDRSLGLNSSNTGDVWFALGNARLHAGHSGAAEALREAERIYRRVNDRHGIARALHHMGIARARKEEHDLAVACFEAAAAQWASIADEISKEELISTQTELCSVLGTSLGRYDDAQTAGRAALDAAARLEFRPDLEARARLALANAQIREGDLSTGRGLLEPALSRAIQSRQADLAAEIAGTLANYAYWVGDLASSERYALRRRELGIESNDPYALRHSMPWLANVAMARGEWGDAGRFIAEAEDDLKRIDSPEPRAFLKQLSGIIALQQGQWDVAVASLEEAVTGFRAIGPGTLPWYLGVLARAYLAAGDHAAMERTVAETIAVVDALPAGSLPRAPSIAQLGIIAVRIEDRIAMRRWRTELKPYGGHFHWVLMDRVLGMLSVGLNDHEAAKCHLLRAKQIAASGQIKPELLRVEGELALSALDSGRNLHSILADMRQLNLADADYVEQRSRITGARADFPAGLSAREVDVLILVAGGKTNREIADLLSISEKTVTNHLTHVFAKADLENRTAAAAFALRHGLVK